MSAFDNIIGYEEVKKELLQICDMFHNREIYAKLGAKFPGGVILFGEPGIGKTMMSQAFIAESGLPAYTVRKTKADSDFVSAITEAFEQARENAPSIVFLDDMDKFANEDCGHRDAEEYVAVQAGIDDAADKDVFVLATVNDIEKLPESLIRTGRFDRRIELNRPSEEDSEKIIAYYLSDKKVADDVNMEDLCKMIRYSSCAEMATILNEAAIAAAFERRDSVCMDNLVRSVLKLQYDTPESNVSCIDEDERRRLALHEAGHLVASEVLSPGSVGLAAIRGDKNDRKGGFVYHCKAVDRRPHAVIVALAAKAAVELYYADHVASGCQSDLTKAAEMLMSGIKGSATYGFGGLHLSHRMNDESDKFKAYAEDVTHALLEEYTLKAKDLLLKNRDFLEKTAQALFEKGVLLHSDIQSIRKSVTITEVAA